MSDGTPIEWTDATVNAVSGCSVASPGCTNCYAMRAGGRNLPGHPSTGLTKPSKGGHVWTGEVRMNERALLDPLRWRRPRRIFWNAHGDLFHENVPDEWIDRCFAVMALTRQHTHQVLTKRSARMRSYIIGLEDRPEAFGSATAAVARAAGLSRGAGIAAIDAVDFPFPNVWLGVSVEDQTRADERVPDLLATPAAVRFLSCEPLLGPVDLGQPLEGIPINAWFTWLDRLDWVIVGGESGSGARPMHPDWTRTLRDQCAATGVPFHFKQWGEWTPGENVERQSGWVAGAHWFDDRWLFEEQNLAATDGHIDDEPDLYRMGKRAAGRRLDGVQHNGMPA